MSAKKKTPQKDSPRPYKQKLLQARELRAQNSSNNHRRVCLLVEVYDDRDWRADLGNVDDMKAA